MRSHAIVALFAFLAGALVVWLIVFATGSPRPTPSPIQPAANGSAIDAAPQPADEIANVPATGHVVSQKTTFVAASAKRTPTELRTLCLLGGFVRSSSEARTPVSSAYVGLFRPALQDDSATSDFGQWGGPPDYRPEWRQLLSWTYTDEDGKFSFDELKAGTYIVRAERGPLVTASTAPQTLEVGEVRAGLDIALPLTGDLEGHILAPPDTSFDTWRVALERADKQIEPIMRSDVGGDDRVRKNVEDDGAFEIGPAQAGLHRVLLVWPGQSTSLGQRNGLPIGEVMIVAGETVKQEFDLRGGFPGSLNVTLHIPLLEREDAPAFHRRIPYTIDARPSFRDAKVESLVATCRLGETVVVGPFEPGMWSLRIDSPLTMWTYSVPVEMLIEAGKSRDVTIEVPLFEGTLTCQDATSGEVLRGTNVSVGVHSPSGDRGMGVKTDDQGRLRLEYPIGTYTLAVFAFKQDGTWDTALPETFDWQADGPHPNSLKLLSPTSAPR